MNRYAEVRASYLAEIKIAIEAAGYTAIPNHNHNLLALTKDGLRLGELDFHGVWETSGGFLAGALIFYSASRRRSSGGKKGTYKLTDSRINLKGFLSRLKIEVVNATAKAAADAADAARDTADDAIRDDLVSDEGVSLPAGVSSLSVWEGKVDMNLSGLSPETAKAVLALIKKS